jgi:(E)-4-hydroxy-3-methylbut-2-enyl-diphosphate synthase
MEGGLSPMKTRVARIGGFAHVDEVLVGGDAPVAIQTMWKERLRAEDLEGAARRIRALGALGCRIMRFAAPDIEQAEAIGRLSRMVSMPLVADIHFDYKIALRCLDFPIAKIRINPGNIGGKDKVRAVLGKAAEAGAPIRIGVNAGSLPKDLAEAVERGASAAEALVEAAEREMAVFGEFGFGAFLVSMKASGVADTVRANRILSSRTDAPLHVGVTEAGPLTAGVARNAAALCALLSEGVGDTARVTLSDSMESEIVAAREICMAAAELAELAGRDSSRLRLGGARIVSCPRCGRHAFDTHAFLARWSDRLYALDAAVAVAVMGCEVNGPEEARQADVGIAGSGGRAAIFRQGKIVRTVAPQDADAAFEEALAEAIELCRARDPGSRKH